jgi:2'-hydroxyisoflavone reductase
MKILIIGGTRFVGRHLVDAALARGHTLTLFNRGQSQPDLFPQAEHLRGDRAHDLSALQQRTWDVVIDTCGYVPRVVRHSAELLAGAVERYVFISTVSVYAEDLPQMDETAPLAKLVDETVEEVTGETYGGLKVLCEKAVEQAQADRALIIRPGLIVGPHDPTDRFTYWPQRIARGGKVLAPGDPDQPVQIIDARDLAAWIVRLIEARQTGIYNAVGPDYTLTMRRMLEEGVAVCNPAAQLIWVGEEFLLSNKVEPWSEMPVWVSAKDAAFDTISNARAVAEGLHFRPLNETMRDTWAWSSTRSPDHEWRAGLKPERETELLHAWQALPH